MTLHWYMPPCGVAYGFPFSTYFTFPATAARGFKSRTCNTARPLERAGERGIPPEQCMPPPTPPTPPPPRSPNPTLEVKIQTILEQPT